MADVLLAVGRGGGREPSDDESLEVHDDGSFILWRTVGWARVGSFAGQLGDSELHDVRRVVDTAPAGDAQGDMPHGAAAEQHATTNGQVTLGGSSDPPAAWSSVVELGRRLLNDLVSAPRAALELSVVSPHESSLAVIGDGPLGIVAPSLRWRVERLDAAGVPLDGWRPDGVEGGQLAGFPSSRDVEPHGPGVWRTLVLGHQWDLAAGEILRVWVTVAIGPVATPQPAGAIPPAPKMARLVAVFPAA